MRVTYEPESDKLRLYVGRVPKDEYLRLRKAGFVATPKQDCDFAAVWSPRREDIALEYLDDDEDIGDEDYSPLERAADRAERFEGYRGKRADEATGHADTFEGGPSAFGNQNRDRAERQARRHDRHRTRAVSQWSKAEYWQQRTAGVISNALHRAKPSVRRGRILTIEADLRKMEAGHESYRSKYDGWKRVLSLPGNDAVPVKFLCDPSLIVKAPRGGEVLFDCSKCDDPSVIAYTLANYGYGLSDYQHPRRELDDAKYNQGRTSLYSLMSDPVDPISPREAAELWLEDATNPYGVNRWVEHLNLRLIYENLTLDLLTFWFGKHQVQKVSKSNVTGRVVSIHVLGPSSANYDRKGNPFSENNPRPMTLHKINVERFGEDAYRAPTDEERVAFAEKVKAEKKAAKAASPPAISLINPTDEDAERLQAILNERGRIKHEAKWSSKYEREQIPFAPTPLLRMTQAEYSERSKGGNSHYETKSLHNAGGIVSRRPSNMWSADGNAYDMALGASVAKLRMRYPGHKGSQWFNPPHVVVLTDKPQKPLPLDWEAVMEPVAEKEFVTA